MTSVHSFYRVSGDFSCSSYGSFASPQLVDPDGRLVIEVGRALADGTADRAFLETCRCLITARKERTWPDVAHIDHFGEHALVVRQEVAACLAERTEGNVLEFELVYRDGWTTQPVIEIADAAGALVATYERPTTPEAQRAFVEWAGSDAPSAIRFALGTVGLSLNTVEPRRPNGPFPEYRMLIPGSHAHVVECGTRPPPKDGTVEELHQWMIETRTGTRYILQHDTWDGSVLVGGVRDTNIVHCLVTDDRLIDLAREQKWTGLYFQSLDGGRSAPPVKYLGRR